MTVLNLDVILNFCMTEIQKLIKEIEDGLKRLIKKAESIDTPRYGIVPQKAIRSMQNGLRGLEGLELGELKNAFDMADTDIKRMNAKMKKKKEC